MTDYRLRQKLISELASSAGLASDRVATEILLYLPPDFLTAYENLFWTCFTPQTSAPLAADRGLEHVIDYGQGPFASSGGKKYREYWVIRDEKAYRRKLRLDAKLKAIAEELVEAEERARKGKEGGKDQREDNTPLCGGCGKFMARTHKYCPSCGTKARGKAGRGG